jgi:hypothetical protein
MSDPAATPESLVATCFALREQAAKAKEALELAEGQLIAMGAGKYSAEGKELQVIAASLPSAGAISYGLEPDRLEVVKKLAGEQFSKLFVRREVFEACEGFELVVPKLLTPKKAENLLLTCKREGKASGGRRAYILYPIAI